MSSSSTTFSLSQSLGLYMPWCRDGYRYVFRGDTRGVHVEATFHRVLGKHHNQCWYHHH